MLDLEVVPERSLGNEQWEFTLGKCGVLRRYPILWFLLPTGLFPSLVSAPYSPAPMARRFFRPIAFGAPGTRYPLQPTLPTSLSLSWALTPSPQALTGPLPGQWYSSNNNNNDTPQTLEAKFWCVIISSSPSWGLRVYTIVIPIHILLM